LLATTTPKIYPLSLHYALPIYAEGHELGSIGFAKDLREIRRHDQLATLGEVAIGLAHEINNPLEVIVNNLNLLEAHMARVTSDRSEEHTSELQSRVDLVCRLLL